MIKNTLFGTKYIISGKLIAPNENEIMVRTIWIKPIKQNILKFVTAYPLQS
ncbi:MAG: hypothetical protein LH473_02655 [Chitinophagales bacterium]|nr:hypothetical protein [Chitinophagales bacterium]